MSHAQVSLFPCVLVSHVSYAWHVSMSMSMSLRLFVSIVCLLRMPCMPICLVARSVWSVRQVYVCQVHVSGSCNKEGCERGAREERVGRGLSTWSFGN